jgi:hypothetical protein
MYRTAIADRPSLTEFNIKYTLTNALSECHHFKMQHYNFLFNLALLAGLIITIIIVLLVKYKEKPTEEEKASKEYKKKEYILSRIQHFQEAQTKLSQGLLTGLPTW